MAEEPEVTIKVSGIAQRIGIYGFALLVGGATVLDLVSPHGRSDPFTGSQGGLLDDRLTYVELIVEQMQDADAACKRRMDAHLEKAERKINHYEVTLERHKIKIDECLERTGVK